MKRCSDMRSMRLVCLPKLYFLILLFIFLVQNCFAGQSDEASRLYANPNYNTKGRTKLVDKYKSIKTGMTPEEVKSILGIPSEAFKMKETRIWNQKNAKSIGYQYKYTIPFTMTQKPSFTYIIVLFDLNWRVTEVKHVGDLEIVAPRTHT